MTDWEITATTVYCDAVDDEVTLIVYRDGTIKCTGHQKYATGKAGNKKKNRKTGLPARGCFDAPISFKID